MSGDGDTEAFKVLSDQIHLLFNPPLRGFDSFFSLSLNEVIQLSPELGTMPLEIV